MVVIFQRHSWLSNESSCNIFSNSNANWCTSWFLPEISCHKGENSWVISEVFSCLLHEYIVTLCWRVNAVLDFQSITQENISFCSVFSSLYTKSKQHIPIFFQIVFNLFFPDQVIINVLCFTLPSLSLFLLLSWFLNVSLYSCDLFFIAALSGWSFA